MIDKFNWLIKNKPNELANEIAITLVWFALTANLVIVYIYFGNNTIHILMALVTALVSVRSTVGMFKMAKDK